MSIIHLHKRLIISQSFPLKTEPGINEHIIQAYQETEDIPGRNVTT
jgi:hypothetical protein